MKIAIEQLAAGEADVCEHILRSLPNWFGIESAIVQYRKDIETMETFVARDSGDIIGFVTIHQHFDYAAEIHVMGVLPDNHRGGTGRAMVEHVEQLLAGRAVEYLQVKTLAPSHPDEGYKKTRTFYSALGFRNLEENKLWGDANPCLIMIKRLQA